MKCAKLTLMAAVVSIGSSAFAAFSIPEVHSATSLAVQDFATKNVDHAEHFTGYKTWKSGEDVKVKVYVAHDGMNMEFNYVCHKHGPKIECHSQQ